MKVWPGQPYPLGATYDGSGTNFSVFSEAAERVQLCLFSEKGAERRVDLTEVDAFCWHGYLPDAGPGQRYGYRVHGSYDPERGQRCNPSKLLLDPYAKAVEGGVEWHPAVYGYRLESGDDLRRDHRNSAPFVPRSVVINPFFDWGNDRSPKTPWHRTVLYETHVKGISVAHPDVPSELRGTYAGLATDPVIDHLLGLGVTAVELLPVHQFVHDHRIVDMGLRNYWGYNSIGYLAPHNEYSSSGGGGQQVQEFKQMVKALHEAGIEVILDVVYNHTGEGNHFGPTLSFRGLDNEAYYRLDEDRRYYTDYTGTGNSLNMRHPHVLQLIMDSLRYWVLEMHIDGFRFDLAVALAREFHDVERLSAFFNIIHQDPVISQVKLIAEPWDVGEGGYQVGNFPPLWSEWNGKYRDTMRDYWRGEKEKVAKIGYRLTGSSDLYELSGRRPYASINFITAHDGFTLEDLVSYNSKHNEANGEENRDGEDHNRSWNCGVEGPTDDPEVAALRERQKRNLLTTLFLSQGIPMLLGGDELGRTQRGNNNAYCQDNEISHYDWGLTESNEDLLEFTRRLSALRKAHPVFRRRRWFLGRPIYGSGVSDLSWFRTDGSEMGDEDWSQTFAKSLAIFLNGEELPSPDPRGRRISDDSFYMAFNAHHEALDFRLPASHWGERWETVLDTADPSVKEGDDEFKAQEKVRVEARSLVVLRRTG